MADPKSPTLIPQSSNQPTPELGKEELYEELLKDDEQQPAEEEEEEEPKIEDKKEDKEDKEGEPEEEIKLVEEETEEEQLDEFVAPVKRQEILKKYPNLFKEFPYLERAYFRDAQFTELIGTPEEAQELIDKAKTLDSFSQQIYSGDLSGVLKQVRENDEATYTKLVNDYLPTLARLDNQAYMTVLSNMYRVAINNMWQEGQQNGDEELQEAALRLNEHLFRSKRLAHPTPYGNPQQHQQVNEAERKIIEREQQFARQQFESTYRDLDTRTTNVLRSTITQHIDPKNVMTDYVRKSAIEDALNQTQEQLENDASFRRHLDGLWKRAFETSFERNAVNKIRSAYLSKARVVLPNVIKNIRNEALKGMQKAKQNSTDRRGPSADRSSSSRETRHQEDKPKIPRGMRTLDYLNSD